MVRHHSLTFIVPVACTSRLLNAIPGIRHAFPDVHETVVFPYAELAPVKLVYGNEVHHYQQPLPTRPHADAVFTVVAGQKVGVVTANCLLMLIASRGGRFVYSMHVDWQGLVSGIVDNSPACFRQQGATLADLAIAVGPHIHPCCYETSAGFYQQVLDQPGDDRVARHCQRLFHFRSGPVSDPFKAATRGSDNPWFDLHAFVEAIFAGAGVSPASVEWLGSCTYCTPRSLGSYRRRTYFPAPKSFQYSWTPREA